MIALANFKHKQMLFVLDNGNQYFDPKHLALAAKDVVPDGGYCPLDYSERTVNGITQPMVLIDIEWTFMCIVHNPPNDETIFDVTKALIKNKHLNTYVKKH